MTISFGRILIVVIVLVVVLLIIKKLSRKNDKEQNAEPAYEENEEKSVKVGKNVSEHKVLNALNDHSFVIRPQFKMCGNCMYWQGDRERIQHSKDIKILDDRKKAKCSNKNACHNKPTNYCSCNCASCTYYERW